MSNKEPIIHFEGKDMPASEWLQLVCSRRPDADNRKEDVTMTTLNGYVSTPSLPDEKGKALLNELEDLHTAISFDPETKRKVRSGSHAERWAIATLKAALVKAAADFERHLDFTAWLNNNNYCHIDAYDPILDRVELTDEIRDLKWRIGCLEKSSDDLHKLLIEICCSPAARADRTDA